MTAEETYDVAIVGYGPIGQMAAIHLALQGRRVIVFERWPSMYPLPRAVLFDHEIARVLQSVGLADEAKAISEPGVTYEWLNAAGERLLFFDWTQPGPSGWPTANMFSQPELQRVLDRKAKSLAGVEVHQGWTVEDLEERDDRVTLTARKSKEEAPGRWAATGEPLTVQARYVIGADGANSFVRDRMGVGVTDLGFSYDWLIADVIEHEPRAWDPPLQQYCDPVRPTTKVSGGPGRRRWEWMLLPGESRETFEDDAMAWKLLELDGLSPANAKLERAVTWTFRARWADSWRRGRLLLAGDSAHLMPPFAGQGMCSGIRDVANLAWRLGLVLDDKAPDALLDSYTPERSRHLQHAIMFSVELGQVICITDPDAAAARDAQMIAARENPALAPPPPPPPRLGAPGIFRDENPAAGFLFIQGRVEYEGRAGLFDDVVGRGWLLVTNGTGELGDEGRARLDSLGGRIVSVTADTHTPRSLSSTSTGRTGTGSPNTTRASFWSDPTSTSTGPNPTRPAPIGSSPTSAITSAANWPSRERTDTRRGKAMRLVSYESDGRWRSGIVVGDRIADTEHVAASAGWSEQERAGLRATRAILALEPARVSALSDAVAAGQDELNARGALHPRDGLRLGPPVPDPPKIICLGLNYRDHAREAGLKEPAAPMFFAKWANSLIGPTDAIVPPAVTEKIDYEAELAVVIGTRGRNIDAAHALEHVAGAMAFNDVSARDLQMANPLWTGGKAIDTFGPCGPALVLLDEIDDLQNLAVRTRVNGETVQDGTTAEMIFGVAETIAFLSRIMTLEPGDIIATGTPAGVGNARDPQLFLHPGDTVEVEIEGIGTLRNRVADPV